MTLEGDDRWYFTKEQLLNDTPSRKHGYDADKELSCRQQAANFIQDIGQKLQVSQLCINTAIVYMHRFYMYHSLVKFHRNAIATAALFLAAKVEEQPRKVEHVLKVAHVCLHRDGSSTLDTKSEAYAEQSNELVLNESLILQTLGFDVAIDHPHTHVVRCCQLVKASKDLAQTSYFMASNSLHLTMMCLQYRPTVVACVCIHLACKWSNWEIPRSSEGKDWFWYVNQSVTLELLEQLTNEFLAIFDKCPTKLKRKMMSMNQNNTPVFVPSGTQESYNFEEPKKLIGAEANRIAETMIPPQKLPSEKNTSNQQQQSQPQPQLQPQTQPQPQLRHIDYKEYKEKKERERLEREMREKQREAHSQNHLQTKPLAPQYPPQKPSDKQQPPKPHGVIHKNYPPSHHRPPPMLPNPKDAPPRPTIIKDTKRKYEEIEHSSDPHKKYPRREGERPVKTLIDMSNIHMQQQPPPVQLQQQPLTTSGIREIITQAVATSSSSQQNRDKPAAPGYHGYPYHKSVVDKYGRTQSVLVTPMPPGSQKVEEKKSIHQQEKISDHQETSGIEFHNKSQSDKYMAMKMEQKPTLQKPRDPTKYPTVPQKISDPALLKQKAIEQYKKAHEKPVLQHWEKTRRPDDRSLPSILDLVNDMSTPVQERSHHEDQPRGPSRELEDAYLKASLLKQKYENDPGKSFAAAFAEDPTKAVKPTSIFSPDINEPSPLPFGQIAMVNQPMKKPSTSLFSPPAFSGAPPQRTDSSSSERELIITPVLEKPQVVEHSMPHIVEMKKEVKVEPIPTAQSRPAVPHRLLPELIPERMTHYSVPTVDSKPRLSYPATSTVNLLGMEKMVDTSISPEKKQLKPPFEVPTIKPPKEEKPKEDQHRKSEKKKKDGHKERHKEKKKSDGKKDKKKHKEKDRERKKTPPVSSSTTQPSAAVPATESALRITIPKDKLGLTACPSATAENTSSLKIKILKDRLKPTGIERSSTEGGLKIKISKDFINSYKDEKGSNKKKESSSHSSHRFSKGSDKKS